MILIRLISLLSFCLLFAGCTTQRVSREIVEVEKAKSIHATYLKIHLKDGFLYVLNSWKVNESSKTITGKGNYYDYNRKLIGSGDTTVPFERIAILETNDKSINPGVATMVIMGILTVPVSLYCLINPKACFGSCPTYYVQNSNADPKLIAEGFSSSICKAMEEKDVDIIDLPFTESRPAQIIVKNEALETHLIRSINLMEVDKVSGGRIFESTMGSFYGVDSMKVPLKATYNLHSVKNKISLKDHDEWYSLADSVDLTKKEDIFLEFENPGKESGLIIDKRQSLLTTFLFYQSLSIMGEATGYYVASIENGNDLLKKRIEKFYNLLGWIEVAVLTESHKWKTIETVREAGPIASDVHLVHLPAINSNTIKIRLRMTKGLWRIDMVNLANIVKEVFPKRIQPKSVYKYQTKDDAALTKLINSNEYLVTFPGEEFTVNYPTNFQQDKEYFIESEGYYIEWMREEWLEYQNLKLARRMLINPTGYLKQMAPVYKALEPGMEEVFWNSRYTNSHGE